MTKSWNKKLAEIWTKMVGPSRPTISELAIYDKWAKLIQSKLDRQLRLLVLGSTPEFRDWGYENNFDITVMDCSEDYYNAITREIRHKSITEKLVLKKWQDLDAVNKFDIIIGDLAIGNIPPEDLEDFIEKVSIALTEYGLFLGKSFYVKKGYKPLSPEQLVEQYYTGIPCHPYSAFVYDLTVNCIDENNMLSFPKQYAVLKDLNENGILSNETFEYFQNVGWDTDMKFLFHVPYMDEFEALLNKYMSIFTTEYGNEVYSKNFPLYIVGRKDNKVMLNIKRS